MVSRAWIKFWSEWAIVGPMGILLVALAVILMGLTHGVVELASRWPRHFMENCEAFFPLAFALATASLITVDADHRMVELSTKLSRIRVLNLRLFAIWAPGLALAVVAVGVMVELWGPVHLSWGLLSGLGPACFLSGLAAWSATLTGRVAVGYLVAIGLPVADLILRVLGAFQAVPMLQWIDCFAYRWQIASPGWADVKWAQLAAGLVLLESLIACSGSLYRRLL